MKRRIHFIIAIFFSLSLPAQEIKPIPLKKYLEYARVSADIAYHQKDEMIARWRETINPEDIFGYRSPGGLLEMASIYATLYELEGTKKYADRAKDILLYYGDFRREFKVEGSRRQADYAEGLPALPDFFTTMRYLRAYDILKSKKYLKADEIKKIDDMIAHSLLFILRTQEWGAMNRAALRAETLSWALRVLPDHEVTPMIRNLEQALVSDNWGQWEIEDASLYHAVWLYALIGCADAKGEIRELFNTPEMYYYAHYFLQLMSPEGMIPDFGDAHNLTNWNRWLVYFETAANVYQNRELKWAASVIADRYLDLDQIPNVGLGYMLLDAWRFGTDKLIPKAPGNATTEVMEDMVGKKVVFRNGWTPKSTYMLLNYRDEGDGGLLFRDYLRSTIPIEEEKVTHGHADENSIALLMHEGSTLLTDGGYRDFRPSGYWGAYRQDYFHNRLCVRNEKIWLGQRAGEYRYSQSDHPPIASQSVLDFMRNAGSYRIVRTQKVDFLTFPDHDYTRTRLIDDQMGYEYDRVIVHIKNPTMFVVFDIIKSRSEQYFTAANFWHTRQIVDQGNHWYDTRYDSIGNRKMEEGQNLLILFPKNHYRFEQVHPEQRNYQQETAIAELSGQFFELGQHTGFITVLIPHKAGEDPRQWVSAVEYVGSGQTEDGLSVRITLGDRIIHTGVKSDMKMGWVRDFQRPKYSWEAGRISCDEVETDSDFFYTDRTGDEVAFTLVNLTRGTYQGQLLYQQPSSYFGLNFDGRPDNPDVGKARYNRGVLRLK